MFDSIHISDWNKPMTGSVDDTELGLWNPYSNASCFIMNLYSMEFGSPPLYSAVNSAARDMDVTKLKDLGPFVRALGQITDGAEFFKQDDDKYTEKESLLWRGAMMKREWIAPYSQNIGKHVRLQGYTSCSRDPKVGLDFAMKDW